MMGVADTMGDGDQLRRGAAPQKTGCRVRSTAGWQSEGKEAKTSENKRSEGRSAHEECLSARKTQKQGIVRAKDNGETRGNLSSCSCKAWSAAQNVNVLLSGEQYRTAVTRSAKFKGCIALDSRRTLVI